MDQQSGVGNCAVVVFVGIDLDGLFCRWSRAPFRSGWRWRRADANAQPLIEARYALQMVSQPITSKHLAY
jgi:hypothetical protein